MSSHRGLLFNTVGSVSAESSQPPSSGLEVEFAQRSDPGRVHVALRPAPAHDKPSQTVCLEREFSTLSNT